MKFSGKIGFAIYDAGLNGIHEEKIIERDYVGDFIKHDILWESSSKLNDDLTQNARISIVSDPFATENYATIRYASWKGVKWKVSNISIQQPRLILILGGVYNG